MQIIFYAHLFALIVSTIGMSRSEMTQNRIVLSNRKVELNLSGGGVGISKFSLLTSWNRHLLFLWRGSFAKIQESLSYSSFPRHQWIIQASRRRLRHCARHTGKEAGEIKVAVTFLHATDFDKSREILTMSLSSWSQTSAAMFPSPSKRLVRSKSGLKIVAQG